MRDHIPVPIIATALACAALFGCGTDSLPVAPLAVAAARGTERPFAGSCAITLAPRVHEDGESCDGSDGHEEGEDDGGPPIGRHFDVTGTCQVAHLGRTALTGRLNLSGPFGGGGHGEEDLLAGDDEGHGQLAVRGRLLLVAANGDQLASTYIPLTAAFARDPQGDGGTLQFTATQRVGGSCSGHDEAGPVARGFGGHDEPESSGRFAGALGEATLTGRLRIGSNDRGTGQLTITNGFLSY